MVLLSGIFDIMDGKVARGTDRVTRFGSLYESTLDLYAEIFVFLGIAYYFINQDMFLSSIASCIFLGGSLMVSYVRARAEGLGFSCKVGIIPRSERIVTLGVSSLIHEYILITGLFLWLLWQILQQFNEFTTSEHKKMARKMRLLVSSINLVE